MLIQNGEFPGNSVKLPVRLIEKGRKSMSRDLPDNTKKIIRKVDRIIFQIENISAGIAYAIMVIVVFIGVILRYLVKTPNLYGEEVSRYLMVMSVFLGIAAGCRQKVHLSVELFISLFPKIIQKVITVFVRTLVVTVYAYMSYAGIEMVRQMKALGQTSPALRLPMWIMYAIITAGFMLSFLTELIMYVNDIFCHGNIFNEEKEDVNI